MSNVNSIARLTPFIILFAVVILFTVIILHLRTITSEPIPVDEILYDNSGSPKVPLSPFSPYPFSFYENEKAKGPKTLLPDLAESLSVASANIEQGLIDKAEDDLKTLYIYYPDSPRLLQMLANILFVKGSYTEAEFFFRKRLAILPDDPLANNDLGAVLAQQGRIAEAIPYEERSLELDPDSRYAELNLSGMYAVIGNEEKAMEYFRKAYERLGEKLLSYVAGAAPQMENIRDNEEYIRIVKEAEKKQAEKQQQNQGHGAEKGDE